MNITCRNCKTLLRRSAQAHPARPDFIAVPWYQDANGARHMALACLHCGTVHDCLGAQRPAIFTALMSPLKINMVKVTATLSHQYALRNAPETPRPAADGQQAATAPLPSTILEALRKSAEDGMKTGDRD